MCRDAIMVSGMDDWIDGNHSGEMSQEQYAD